MKLTLSFQSIGPRSVECIMTKYNNPALNLTFMKLMLFITKVFESTWWPLTFWFYSMLSPTIHPSLFTSSQRERDAERVSVCTSRPELLSHSSPWRPWSGMGWCIDPIIQAGFVLRLLTPARWGLITPERERGMGRRSMVNYFSPDWASLCGYPILALDVSVYARENEWEEGFKIILCVPASL